MTIGILDSACITSVIDCLHCEKLESASSWAYKTAFEATAELIINPYFGLAPSPEGARPSVGEFGYIQQRLALRPPKPLFIQSNATQAEEKAKDWFGKNSRQFRQSFKRLNNTEAFKSWLNHEVDFIWENHTESQGGLFNKKLIPELAVLLRKNPLELEELRQLSGNWLEVKNLAKAHRTGNDFLLLGEAYAGSFFLRGIYHDYAARLNGYSIMPHGLRRIRGFLPAEEKKTTLQFEHSQTTTLLANLIVQCARKEKEAHRSVAYSEYISIARQRLDALDLSPKSTIESAREAAAQAAKIIELRAKPRWVYDALDAGIALMGGGITSFCLDPFHGFVIGHALWMLSRKENMGRRLGRVTFDTKMRFKAMLESPPGRLRANWD